MHQSIAPELPLWAFPALFGTGLAAGFVDSIAGGGGLIALPVILSLGFPAKLALGTNKLQASFGSGSAMWHYTRAGVANPADGWMGILFTMIGAFAGTLLVQRVSPEFLKQFIPLILLALAAYTLFRPKLGDQDIHPRVSPPVFYIFAGLALGFYDGFFGPGAGSFWTMAFMLGLGFNLTRATGCTKVMNFASNIVSFLFFARAGQIHYAAGLCMGIGQLFGAKLGSGMVVSRGTRFIRPVFITVVVILALKLLSK